MLFSSIPFLFYFLPCVFVLYFLVPMRWKNTVLLLASLFFYAWGEPKFVVFMLASIVQAMCLPVWWRNTGRTAGARSSF